MTYEEMDKKLRDRAYDNDKTDENFFNDLLKLHNLDANDPIVHRMYSMAYENGHAYGRYEVFIHFNDLVHVFKG